MERLGGCASTECRGRVHEVTDIHAAAEWYPIGIQFTLPLSGRGIRYVPFFFLFFFIIPPIGPLLDLGEKTALDRIWEM